VVKWLRFLFGAWVVEWFMFLTGVWVVKWSLTSDYETNTSDISSSQLPMESVPYHHLSREFEPCSCRGVLNTTLCDKFCQ
jgi:hypothetical protein